MTPLYAYTLVPVFVVATMLGVTAAQDAASMGRGIVSFCASIAFWTLSLLLIYFEPLAQLGQRFAASGAFVVAGYCHLAWDVTDQPRYWLVWLAYASAIVIVLGGAVVPGMLYDPVSLAAGPMFWPGMALAVSAALLPMWKLARAAYEADGAQRRTAISLIVAGIICYTGAWGNALLLANGIVLPYGILLVLGALFVLARVVSRQQDPASRRLLESSLLYSALTALIWAGFLFGMLAVVSGPAASLAGPYRAGALFLLCMAAIAFEPIRRAALNWIGRRFFPDRVRADELAKALVEQETRSDQAERLAELGAFTSAIAHEVRNPLGVLAAHLKMLERRGADDTTIEAMRAQLDRASAFVDDLVHYGRPRPLELRRVDLSNLIELAISTARQARGGLAAQVDIEVVMPDDGVTIEADQSQLLQVLVILLDNAILALRAEDAPEIRVEARRVGEAVVEVVVEDNGPGFPDEIVEAVFEPFVTGRGRDAEAKGTGLGLAIARRIVTRHHGEMEAAASQELGGASCVMRLPMTHQLMAAAVQDQE